MTSIIEKFHAVCYFFKYNSVTQNLR